VAKFDNEYGVSFRPKRMSDDDDAGNSSEETRLSPMDEVEVDVEVDFPRIMQRMRKLRSKIAPVDGHERGSSLGTQTFQGRGVFTSPTTIEVVEHGKSLGDASNPTLKFRKAVVATGGRPNVPSNIVGLAEAPYTTNLDLFNLQILPKRMVVLGAGIVALEMAQAFAAFGSEVTVLQRSRLLSKGDDEAAVAVKAALEEDGVTFLSGVEVGGVATISRGGGSSSPSSAEDDGGELPLMRVSLTCDERPDGVELECECLLLALGRARRTESMGLEDADVEFDPARGVLVDDYARSVSNPNVYAVGDCVANVPRLTHVSGEMAKVVVQNSLFEGQWKLSSFVVPAVMYTDPEYATVGRPMSPDENGLVAPAPNLDPDEVDVYRAELRHNDRAILDSSDDGGFVKIFCEKGTGRIVGCAIVSSRAGEMINEVSLAIKHGIDLEGVGRNIHSYPTLGETVMGCGLQYINSKWKTF